MALARSALTQSVGDTVAPRVLLPASRELVMCLVPHRGVVAHRRCRAQAPDEQLPVRWGWAPGVDAPAGTPPVPAAAAVVLDPAGWQHVSAAWPDGAGGASGALYGALRMAHCRATHPEAATSEAVPRARISSCIFFWANPVFDTLCLPECRREPVESFCGACIFFAAELPEVRRLDYHVWAATRHRLGGSGRAEPVRCWASGYP